MPEEMTPIAVREKLVEALQIDLVGPGRGLGDPKEVLPQAPSRWYLTGFLVPLGAKPEQRKDETAEDELDEAGEKGEVDENVPVEKAAARPRFFPSSIGASVIVPADAVGREGAGSLGRLRRQSTLPRSGNARSGRKQSPSLSLMLTGSQKRSRSRTATD